MPRYTGRIAYSIAPDGSRVPQSVPDETVEEYRVRRAREVVEEHLSVLEQADADWPNLSTAQRMAATRFAVRVVYRLARLVLARHDRAEVDE